MEYSIKPKSLGERRIIHYPQKRIIGLYVNSMYDFNKKRNQKVVAIVIIVVIAAMLVTTFVSSLV